MKSNLEDTISNSFLLLRVLKHFETDEFLVEQVLYKINYVFKNCYGLSVDRMKRIRRRGIH